MIQTAFGPEATRVISFEEFLSFNELLRAGSAFCLNGSGVVTPSLKRVDLKSSNSAKQLDGPNGGRRFSCGDVGAYLTPNAFNASARVT